MSFFKNFRAELGTGAGKGVNALIATLWDLFFRFCAWLFRWTHRSGEHPLHTNSFRIAVGSFIIALFVVPGMVTCSVPSIPSFTLPIPFISNTQEATTATVKTQLRTGISPIIPEREFFLPFTGAEGEWSYQFIGGRNYLQYRELADGRPLTMKLDEPVCVVVPAGKEVNILTERPPVYAVNMEIQVTYVKKPEYSSPLWRFYLSALKWVGSAPTPYYKNEPWGVLYRDWATVDTSLPLVAHALPLNQIPDSVNAPGGIVCF